MECELKLRERVRLKQLINRRLDDLYERADLLRG